MAELLDHSRRRTVRLWAVLKVRGYRWSPGECGRVHPGRKTVACIAASPPMTYANSIHLYRGVGVSRLRLPVLGRSAEESCLGGLI
jgi:hypothetical protein